MPNFRTRSGFRLSRRMLAREALRLGAFIAIPGPSMAVRAQDSAPMRTPSRTGQQAHLSVNSRLDDLLRHPAFAGFARMLLPWDDRAYDGDMPLSRIASLLPYHTAVDPRAVVGALNLMIDAINRGDPVFHDIYTADEKQRRADKANTGLFFLRGRPGAPFAIVAPGGGFSYVGSVHEGFPYAQAISAAGYNAFVLKYRVGQGGGAPNEDLAAAITYVMRNAGHLGVGTRHHSLWGSSAGARMAASLGSHGVARFGGDAAPKPSAIVMAYTSHADHSADEPSTFVVVGEQDGIAPPATMRRRVEQLRRMGVRVEYREYPRVAHGFGLGTGTSAEGWIDHAIRFWQVTMPAR